MSNTDEIYIDKRKSEVSVIMSTFDPSLFSIPTHGISVHKGPISTRRSNHGLIRDMNRTVYELCGMQNHVERTVYNSTGEKNAHHVMSLVESKYDMMHRIKILFIHNESSLNWTPLQTTRFENKYNKGVKKYREFTDLLGRYLKQFQKHELEYWESSESGGIYRKRGMF